MGKRIGNRPTAGTGTLIGSTGIGGEPWELWEHRIDKPSADAAWGSVKLICLVPRDKANFWLGWNYQNARLAFTRDAGLLASDLPEVYAWAESVLRNL